MEAYDVVVVGAGNAAMCAALAAREHGVKVAVLEWAAFGDHGGNSAFTAGAIRTVYNGVDDLRAIMPDLAVPRQRASAARAASPRRAGTATAVVYACAMRRALALAS